MSGISREILKWLQGLDLSYSVKNPKRDFSNGFLVAEILSRYWKEIPMHSFDNGTAIAKKQDNWGVLEKIMRKNGLSLPREVVEGVIHQKDNSAVTMLETLYTHLTKRSITVAPPLNEPTVPKPMFAAPTVATRMREAHPQADSVAGKMVLDADQAKQKNQAILQEHAETLKQTKVSNPEYFAPKPRPPPSSTTSVKSTPSNAALKALPPGGVNTSATSTGAAPVAFKQVTVKSVDESILNLRSGGGRGGRGNFEGSPGLKGMNNAGSPGSANTSSSADTGSGGVSARYAGNMSPGAIGGGGTGIEDVTLRELLSETCENAFTELGVSFHRDSTSESTDSAFLLVGGPKMVVKGGATDESMASEHESRHSKSGHKNAKQASYNNGTVEEYEDYFALFLSNLSNPLMNSRIKEKLWSSLLLEASKIAQVVLLRPSEYFLFISHLSFVLDSQQGPVSNFSDYDWSKALSLVCSVGFHLASMNPQISAYVFLNYCLPRYRTTLLTTVRQSHHSFAKHDCSFATPSSISHQHTLSGEGVTLQTKKVALLHLFQVYMLSSSLKNSTDDASMPILDMNAISAFRDFLDPCVEGLAKFEQNASSKPGRALHPIAVKGSPSSPVQNAGTETVNATATVNGSKNSTAFLLSLAYICHYNLFIQKGSVIASSASTTDKTRISHVLAEVMVYYAVEGLSTASEAVSALAATSAMPAASGTSAHSSYCNCVTRASSALAIFTSLIYVGYADLVATKENLEKVIELASKLYTLIQQSYSVGSTANSTLSQKNPTALQRKKGDSISSAPLSLPGVSNLPWTEVSAQLILLAVALWQNFFPSPENKGPEDHDFIRRTILRIVYFHFSVSSPSQITNTRPTSLATTPASIPRSSHGYEVRTSLSHPSTAPAAAYPPEPCLILAILLLSSRCKQKTIAAMEEDITEDTKVSCLESYIQGVLNLSLPKLRDLLLCISDSTECHHLLFPSMIQSESGLDSALEDEKQALTEQNCLTFTYVPCPFPTQLLRSFLEPASATGGVLLEWDSYTVASALCDMTEKWKAHLQEANASVPGSSSGVAVIEEHDRDIVTGEFYLSTAKYLPIMTIFANGICHDGFLRDKSTSVSMWWSIWNRIEKDIQHNIMKVTDEESDSSEITTTSSVETESNIFRSLLVHIITQFYLKLTTQDSSPAVGSGSGGIGTTSVSAMTDMTATTTYASNAATAKALQWFMSRMT